MNIESATSISGLDQLDKEIILSYTLKKTREYLLAHPEKKLTKPQVRKFNSLLLRRKRGEPIAYIIGRKEFYGLDFFVNKSVLIPRPETEILVEEVINKIFLLDPRFHGDDKLMLIDIGTGSGNIIISIVKNIPTAIRNKINFFATDISVKALGVARKNAKRHRIDKSIEFIRSNLLEFIKKQKAALGKNILITANLPYVSPSLYNEYKSNLRYEPKEALISRKNGLNHYFQLLKQIKKICVTCYMLRVTCYLEISPEQKHSIEKLFKDALPKGSIKFQKDLAGKWRMAVIET